MKNYLELKNITKTYDTKNDKVIALNDVSYKFDKGKFYAIMGHSGSGKSTLISILGTLDNFNQGKYKLDGNDVSNLNDSELSDIRMKKIGFIFQNYSLDPDLKAFENVMLPMYINNEIKKENIKSKALELLDYVNMSDRVNHYPKELSGGEAQRVAIARSLANNPDIILADEPTGNLDEDNEKIILDILKRLSKEGKCVIVVSHNNIVFDYADVVLKMSKGKIGDNNER